MSREEHVHLAKRVKMVTSSQSISLNNQITEQMSRDGLVYLAKQARKVCRYKDMVELMEIILERCVESSEELTKEEKMLLSVAYKDVIKGSFSSLTRLAFTESKEKRRGNEEKLSIVKGYMEMIKFDITKQCILLFQNTGKMSQEENVFSILGKWLENVTPSLSISFVNQNTMKMHREEIVYRAKLAMKAKRYNELVELMKQVVKMCADDSEELTEDERGILSEAYENMFPSLMYWMGLSFIERKEEKLGNENHVSLIKCYEGMMESLLTDKCNVFLDLVASYAAFYEFCLEKTGDHFDRLAEFKTGAEKDAAYQNSTLI